MWLFGVFLLVPLIEIGLFIQVGSAIGLWPTLAIVVITAIVGTILLRVQGLQTLRKLRGSLDQLGDPTEPLVHGAMIILAGALLLTPGFFTDAVGLALMVPSIRSAVFRAIRSRVQVVSTTHGGSEDRSSHRPDVIDGEWHEVDRTANGMDVPPSRGTRH